MSPDEFKHWRALMGFSRQLAADALGLSVGSIDLYEQGSEERQRPLCLDPEDAARHRSDAMVFRS
jgi:hypothetical protein